MRILALVTDAFGGQGGIAKFNRDMLTALCRWPAVEEVIAFPRLRAPAGDALPSRLRYLVGSAGGKLNYGRALASHLARDRRVNGVICGHLHLLPLAALAARASGAPLLLVVHGIEAWSRPKGRLAGRLVKRADAFVAVSQTTRDRFMDWSALDPSRGFVIPNCIDASSFGPGPKREDLVRRYGLAGRRVLLTVGRLAASERYKGHDEILSVLPEVVRDVPAVTYLIVGEGDDRGRLEARAAALGLNDRVIFAGHVPDSEKADHYRLADLFVMPGRGEGFGIVYLEALACGVPVVASTVDASREAVVEGELGRLVDPSKPEEIRQAILAGLTQPPVRALPVSLEHFSFERFEARWRDVAGNVFLPSSRIAHSVQPDVAAHV